MRKFSPTQLIKKPLANTHTNHKANRHSRLWLAVRLIDLPLMALGVDVKAPQAIAITEKQRVVYANAAAQTAGVVSGMDITTAQLLSNCELHPRNSKQEQQTLEQLAQQLYQFTPYIDKYFCQTTPAAGLLLELSRCLKLFSGLVSLSGKIFSGLENISFEYGLAHSAKGAWMLSHQQHPITGAEDKTLFYERLKSLPVQCLYDYPQAVEALEKTGFNTLGDIARQIEAQSISSFKKRFGQEFVLAVCDIFGIEQNFQQNSLFDKPVNVYQPTEFFNEWMQFDYPINQTGQLHLPIETMLQKLSEYLRKRQLECQHIEWQLYDIYRRCESLSVQCDSAQSHWQILYDLTLIQLDHQQLPFEVDTLELFCQQARPMQNRNQTLGFDNRRHKENRTRDFAITAAKLKARLGDSAVFKLSYQDSHIPEISNAAIPLAQTCNQSLPELQRVALRPTWLFDAPIAIENRTQGLYWHGYLTILAGPERIQGNWWCAPIARDYFLAQRSDYLRLWIFLDLHQKTWYAQGVFS